MTTAATDTFTQSRDEIVDDALTNLGAIGPGRTPTGAMRTHANRALNRLVKSIDADGAFLWRVVRRTLSTVAAQATYTLGTDVLSIDEPANYLRAGQTGRTPILSMSRDDYMVQSDRASAGVSSRYFQERTLAGLVVTFWPVPDATADSIEYAAVLRCKDFVIGSDTPDFNSKWIVCLVLGLSATLAPAYGQDSGAWDEKFEAERSRQLNADNEGGSLTLVPFGGSYY